MNERDRMQLEDAFRLSLPLPQTLEPHLRDSLDRVLRKPGSLVRPDSVFQMGTAYELPEASAAKLAIALEYFHTASLLFDDLPCMDDASERRGIPCVHIQFGESGAILTALAFINRAYALTWQAVAGLGPDRQTRTLNYVECHLGVEGLLNGQSMDLNFATSPQDRHTVERIAFGKTVSLIRLAFIAPAILGGAPAPELQLLDRIAIAWGLSYQIVDDLRDVLQTAEQSGKTASRDASLNRPNLALAIGVDAAIVRLARLIAIGDRMLQRLVILRPGVGFLQGLRAELGREAQKVTRAAHNPELTPQLARGAA